VIHVGPHKTGSSSIQGFIAANKFKILQNMDHYWIPLFFKKWKVVHLAVCLNKDAIERTSKDSLTRFCNNFDIEVWKTHFEEFVVDIASRNNDGSPSNNILMSSEEFDRHKVDIEWLQKTLEPEFEVRIVMYYRPFHHWLASYYNQLAKFPLGKGLEFPSMPDWLDQELEKRAEQHTYKVYRRYSDFFPGNVRVFNFDNPSVPHGESFFCDAVPGADHSCQMIRSESANETRHRNQKLELEYPELKMELRARNISDRLRSSDNGVRGYWNDLRYLEHIVDKNPGNIPLWMDGDPPPDSKAIIWRKCPSRKTLDKILTMTQFYEEELKGIVFPPVSNSTQTAMEDDFRKRIPMSFCSLDTGRVVDHWLKQDWFQQLISEETLTDPDTGHQPATIDS